MLHQWEKKFPGRTESIFRALQNVAPSHLADRTLFDFAALKPQNAPYPDGDLAFDEEALRVAEPHGQA
jgi:tRNA 2-thiocytidine biosynthesis protein TtcA